MFLPSLNPRARFRGGDVAYREAPSMVLVRRKEAQPAPSATAATVSHPNSNNVLIIVLATVGGAVLLLCAMGIAYYIWLRRKRHRMMQSGRRPGHKHNLSESQGPLLGRREVSEVERPRSSADARFSADDEREASSPVPVRVIYAPPSLFSIPTTPPPPPAKPSTTTTTSLPRLEVAGLPVSSGANRNPSRSNTLESDTDSVYSQPSASTHQQQQAQMPWTSSGPRAPLSPIADEREPPPSAASASASGSGPDHAYAYADADAYTPQPYHYQPRPPSDAGRPPSMQADRLARMDTRAVGRILKSRAAKASQALSPSGQHQHHQQERSTPPTRSDTYVSQIEVEGEIRGVDSPPLPATPTPPALRVPQVRPATAPSASSPSPSSSSSPSTPTPPPRPQRSPERNQPRSRAQTIQSSRSTASSLPSPSPAPALPLPALPPPFLPPASAATLIGRTGSPASAMTVTTTSTSTGSSSTLLPAMSWHFPPPPAASRPFGAEQAQTPTPVTSSLSLATAHVSHTDASSDAAADFARMSPPPRSSVAFPAYVYTHGKGAFGEEEAGLGLDASSGSPCVRGGVRTETEAASRDAAVVARLKKKGHLRQESAERSLQGVVMQRGPRLVSTHGNVGLEFSEEL